MASLVLGQPFLSGPQPIASGNFFSGKLGIVGSVRLTLDPSASGNAYIYYSGVGLPPQSGGPTLRSGGMMLSGIGLMDGMILAPNQTYVVPKLVIGPSGTVDIYAYVDQAGSGQARLWWDSY